MKKLILIGGGGHCKACIDVIEKGKLYNVAGIVDLPQKMDSSILGYPYIGTDEDLPTLIQQFPYALISLGQIESPTRRIELFSQLKRLDVEFPLICSPIAYISPHAEVGEGTIVLHNAIINAGAKIGKNCIINTRAVVEHDAIVEDHCHISAGAVINGEARVGYGSFIGSGAITKECITISPNSFIKANSLVHRDL